MAPAYALADHLRRPRHNHGHRRVDDEYTAEYASAMDAGESRGRVLGVGAAWVRLGAWLGCEPRLLH